MTKARDADLVGECQRMVEDTVAILSELLARDDLTEEESRHLHEAMAILQGISKKLSILDSNRTTTNADAVVLVIEAVKVAIEIWRNFSG